MVALLTTVLGIITMTFPENCLSFGILVLVAVVLCCFEESLRCFFQVSSFKALENGSCPHKNCEKVISPSH